LELKAQNLGRRIQTELAAGDMQLAELHLSELRALLGAHPALPVDLPHLEAAFGAAQARLRAQRRHRRILVWAATLLLVGHAVGVTLSLIRSYQSANELSRQKAELSLRSDREVRTLSLQMGEHLMQAGRPGEAMQYFGKAMALSQVIEGPASEAAVETARKFEEASRKASAATGVPPSQSE
jgi:hypothetical protein